MSVNGKKVLSIIAYYTLMALTLASVAFFAYVLSVKDVPTWARVIYYAWVGLVIATVIFDIICTCNGAGKFVSGLIVYFLSLAAVLMAIILYCINAGKTGLMADFFNIFISVSIVSLMTTGYLIASWCVGESLIEHATAEDKMARRRSNTQNN